MSTIYVLTDNVRTRAYSQPSQTSMHEKATHHVRSTSFILTGENSVNQAEGNSRTVLRNIELYETTSKNTKAILLTNAFRNKKKQL